MILRFFLFFLDLSSQDLQKLRLQENFFNSNKNFNNKFNNLTDGKFETNAVWNDYLIVDALIPIKRNDVIKLSINFFKLFANELLKQENLSIFVNIKKSIEISSHGSADLPSICIF